MAQQRAGVEGSGGGKKPMPRGLSQSSQSGGISGALKTIMAPGVALSKAQQSALMAYLKSLADSASKLTPKPGSSSGPSFAGAKPSKPQPKPVKPEPKTKPPMSRPKPKPKPPTKLPKTR
jgi:hypothetical protein